MRRRDLIRLLAGTALAWPSAVIADKTAAQRRIGVLMSVAETDADANLGLASFRKRLDELGWHDGGNLRCEYRWGAADSSRIAASARELVRLSPDLILAHTTPAVMALQRETASIPIVFVTVTDPLGQRLVASLAHPGGNVTGFSVYLISLGAKWLEMLKEIAPSMKRAAILFNPQTAPYYPLYIKAIEQAAPSFLLGAVANPVHDELEIEAAIRSTTGGPASGWIVLPDSFNSVHRELIIKLMARYRQPAIYYFRYFATNGGLIAYGPDETDLFRRAAGYVDRILEGASPGDLPVQQPSKFELVINLKTAKALGLDIPPTLLASADEVIE
jgi:putative tryptophan/tyrosine transport system substrate-binding protein